MKKKQGRTVKQSEQRSTDAAYEVPKQTNVQKARTIFLLIVLVGLSFYCGNLVGSKLAQLGYREKIVEWKDRMMSSKKKTQSSAVNPNAQVLTVGDVTIVSPGNNAGQAEQDAFVNAIEKTAVEATSVTISGSCSLTPKVVKIVSGSTLTFENTDSVSHTLKIGANKKDVVVEPGAKVAGEYAADFVGIHGLVCDSANAHVGFLQVTAK